MAKLTITVYENPAVVTFSVVVHDATNTSIIKSYPGKDFTKTAAGTFSSVITAFTPGPTLPAALTVSGQGDPVGTPLAWAQLNLNGKDLNPHIAAQLFTGQTVTTSTLTYPLS